jgi:tetratricopeptide (TPR) repeat protein
MPQGADPYTGKFKEIMDSLKRDKSKALSLAWGWHEEQPGDILALVALGEALEANGNPATAARAYGSIIDLFPARADLRRFAGVRLERIAAALAIATDTFAKAVEQRADHPASHRLYAYALVRAGKYEQAFAAIAKGIAQRYPDGRFLGVDRILREDAGLIAAAWIKAEPSRRPEILGKLKAAGGTPENAPSVRFVLNWETDANDVDFHIADARGGHAFFSQPHLPSGGDLYADVTTGYGPECFTIRAPKGKRAGPYKLQAHYYSIGPMGAGMGKLEIIEHDGTGGLTFEERPYVVMVNDAFVDLGVVKN